MQCFIRFTSPLIIALLAACQTTPPESATVQACPEVAPLECPVCEPAKCPSPPEPTAQITAKPPPAAEPPPASAPAALEENDLTVIGAVEWARVEPSNLIMEARIDTGAETSSIHAENIQLLEKDGKRYVQFTLLDSESGEDIPVERRLHRRVVIKQNTDGPQDRRYVVRMWVTVGEKRLWLDVSLSDRKDFEYELLLGRNMLIDEFVVDVSKQHTQSRKKLLLQTET